MLLPISTQSITRQEFTHFTCLVLRLVCLAFPGKEELPPRLAFLGDAYSPSFPSTSWFIRLFSPFLLGFTKRSSLDRRLYKWKATWFPHVLTINWVYQWLIAGLVSGHFVTVMHILLNLLSIKKYVGNGMGTWYTC